MAQRRILRASSAVNLVSGIEPHICVPFRVPIAFASVEKVYKLRADFVREGQYHSGQYNESCGEHYPFPPAIAAARAVRDRPDDRLYNEPRDGSS